MSNQNGIVRLVKKAAVLAVNEATMITNRLFSNRKGKAVFAQLAAGLPKSNGSRFYERLPLRVGIVADPFVLQNFEKTCQLVPMTPDTWQDALGSIDCLLVTSTWRGADGEWIGLGSFQTPQRRQLLDLMRTARSRGCPVLFYSKEDPPNYDIFLEYAKEADCIFTSAQECLPDYREACPGAQVHVLTFSVNPLLHNPIGSEGEKVENSVFFAGSWMVKYAKRTERMVMMFRLFLDAGLKLYIADRNFSRRNFRYQYPLRYLRYVLGDFSYEQLAQMYKLFPWCMNINSVTASDTMFAMRVYDALACGIQVLSNESQGIRRMFPEVHVIQKAEDLKAVMSLSKEELRKNKAGGIRNVLRQGTVFEKMEFMLRSSGIYTAPESVRRIGVMLPEGIDAAWEKRLVNMFEKQTYPWKVLVRTEEQAAGCDMLCLWGAGREYGEYYLEDMVNGFKYTDCDYITKRFDLPEGSGEHVYTDCITDLYATVFWASAVTPAQLRSLPTEKLRMPNGYAADRENYNVYESIGEAI